MEEVEGVGVEDEEVLLLQEASPKRVSPVTASVKRVFFIFTILSYLGLTKIFYNIQIFTEINRHYNQWTFGKNRSLI